MFVCQACVRSRSVKELSAEAEKEVEKLVLTCTSNQVTQISWR